METQMKKTILVFSALFLAAAIVPRAAALGSPYYYQDTGNAPAYSNAGASYGNSAPAYSAPSYYYSAPAYSAPSGSGNYYGSSGYGSSAPGSSSYYQFAVQNYAPESSSSETPPAQPGTASSAAAIAAELAGLQAKLLAFKAALAQATSTPQASVPASVFVFTKNLSLGSTGEDVRQLQRLLNRDPATAVNAAGKPGGPGLETAYFGALTKDAVIRFQERHAAEILAPLGMVYGTGVVDSVTRLVLNRLEGQAAR